LDSANVFLNFRPIYILFIIVLVVSLFIIIFQKSHNKVINGFTVIVTLLISFIVSAYLTYQIGILSDELAIGGDAISMVMFFVVVSLSVVNLIVYLFKK
jgi:hypothetical protein